VRRAEFSGTPDDGWEVVDVGAARTVTLTKPKPQDEAFEDRIWVLLSEWASNLSHGTDIARLDMTTRLALPSKSTYSQPMMNALL